MTTATDPRRRVLLTGATGNWGRAALREFASRSDEFVVRAFAMPTDADRAVLADRAADNIEPFFGDLTSYADVARAIEGVDVVLHVGALVSPMADERPRLAWRVNVGSMQNIVRAVKALPDPGAVAVVGVGSVAETGDRPVPHHWGRIGDPVRVSQFDEYGQTKVVAEKILVESGLPRWAWLRQTGILSSGMMELRDPIATHTPLDEVMEWISPEDSARLLAGVASAEAPEEFWGQAWNIGGGEPWRLTNWEFQVVLGRALGLSDLRKRFERNWFATGNFHGQWYTDSDALQALVPFRRDTVEEAVDRAVQAASPAVRAGGRIPPWAMKNLIMRPLAHRPRGTLHALRRRDPEQIAAHYGSREAWQGIGDWSTFEVPNPSRTPTYLDHGYDESKDPSAWTAQDYRGAAAFRGGELLSEQIGDPAVPLVWRCAFEHVFAASPRLVLRLGHWCPECVRDSAGYHVQAERNPFLGQLYGG